MIRPANIIEKGRFLPPEMTKKKIPNPTEEPDNAE